MWWVNETLWDFESVWASEVYTPDSKVHEANMGPILGRQDPGGPHVGPTNIAIWDLNETGICLRSWEMSSEFTDTPL